MNRLFAALTAILLFAFASVFPTVFAQTITLEGSDAIGTRLVPHLAEAFKANERSVSFTIIRGTSPTGIAAVVSGKASLGMSTRTAEPAELAAAQARGFVLTPHTIGFDPLVIIANSANPVHSLTETEVAAIFTGKTRNWKGVGGRDKPITVFTWDAESCTSRDFQDLALHGAAYSNNAQPLPGNAAIADTVARDPSSIGYVSLAYASKPGVSILAVGGVLPSEETLNAGHWLYLRPAILFSRGEPSEAERRFLDFALGDQGQRIVRELGFIPRH